MTNRDIGFHPRYLIYVDCFTNYIIYIFITGTKIMNIGEIEELDGHIKGLIKPDLSTKRAFFSPSIVYAGKGTYARRER